MPSQHSASGSDQTQYRGWTILLDTSGGSIRCLDPNGRESLPSGIPPRSLSEAQEWIDASLLSKGDPNLFYHLIGFPGGARTTKFKHMESSTGTLFYEVEHPLDWKDGSHPYRHFVAITAVQDLNMTLHLNTAENPHGIPAILTPESALSLAYLLRLAAEELLKRRK